MTVAQFSPTNLPRHGYEQTFDELIAAQNIDLVIQPHIDELKKFFSAIGFDHSQSHDIQDWLDALMHATILEEKDGFTLPNAVEIGYLALEIASHYSTKENYLVSETTKNGNDVEFPAIFFHGLLALQNSGQTQIVVAGNTVIDASLTDNLTHIFSDNVVLGKPMTLTEVVSRNMLFAYRSLTANLIDCKNFNAQDDVWVKHLYASGRTKISGNLTLQLAEADDISANEIVAIDSESSSAYISARNIKASQVDFLGGLIEARENLDADKAIVDNLRVGGSARVNYLTAGKLYTDGDIKCVEMIVAQLLHRDGSPRSLNPNSEPSP